MRVEDLLDINDIHLNFHATSKKQALRHACGHLGHKLGLDSDDMLSLMLEREKLGSTGVGHGVAIPHARMESALGITAMLVVFDQPIDFDAIDDLPVDLMLIMVAPMDAGTDHLKALSRVSRLLRDESICDKLRGAGSGTAVMAIITEHTHAIA